MKPWQEMTPAEVLDAHVVLNMSQLAYVLGLISRDGQPNRRAARDVVRTGRIHLIDPSQPPHRWSVSAADVRRYVAGQ